MFFEDQLYRDNMIKNVKCNICFMLFWGFLLMVSAKLVASADDLGFTIHEYDYAEKTIENTVYDGRACIAGLTTFNAIVQYSGELTDITYEWEVLEESKNILTVTATGTNMAIGRVVGLAVGTGSVCVRALSQGEEVWASSFQVTVSSMELTTEIYEPLYVEGTELTLPTVPQIINDYDAADSAHPRIMTNAKNMQLVDKFLTYAWLQKKEASYWSEYEQLVYNEINNMYLGEEIPLDYFCYLRAVYDNISLLADEKIENGMEYKYVLLEGSLTTQASEMECEIEQLGFMWLLYNAHVANIQSYENLYSSNMVYQDILNDYQESQDFLAYPRRIVEIMDAVTAYQDWNPDHFLDVGKISYSMGVAYDWIYDYLTDEQRVYYAEAIKRLGVDEGNRYLTSIYSQQKFKSNWCACNFSGVAVAAMAIFSEDESYVELCAKQIESTARFLPVFLYQYAPDGALSESTGYWILSERYVSYLLSSLVNTFGTDYGLMDVKGFEESWYFPINITGKDSLDATKALTYNYGDAIGGEMAQSALVWFVERKAQLLEPLREDYLDETNVLMWFKNKYTDTSDYTVADVQDLLWFPLVMARHGGNLKAVSDITDSDILNVGVQKEKYFAKTDDVSNNDLAAHDLMSDTVIYGRGAKVTIVTATQSFVDETATFFAIKDSNAKSTHRDLDAGSFVFDALGVRWINDWGKTTYSGERYSYYIKRAEGHSTLVINPTVAPDQNTSTSTKTSATTSINQEQFYTNSNGLIVQHDISNAYNVVNGATARNGNQVLRGYMLYDDGKKLMIQDEIALDEPSDVYSFFQTVLQEAQYDISEDGQSVIMTTVNDAGEIVRMKALLKVSSDNQDVLAKFTTMRLESLVEELNENHVNQEFSATYSNYRKLAIHVSEDSEGNVCKVKNAVITVLFIPIFEEADYDVEIEEIMPIAEWENHPYIRESNQDDVKLYFNKNSIVFSRLIATDLTVSSNLEDLDLSLIEWVTDNEDVAVVGSNGRVIAKGYGTCNIKAVWKNDPSVFAECEVSVLVPDKITLNKDSITFSRLIATYVKAKISNGDAVNQELVWSSDDTSVATVSVDGKVTAVGPGTCYITVQSKVNPQASATCKVSVEATETITLNKETIAFSRLIATYIKAEISNSNMTKQELIWSSDDSSVATVNDDGKVTAVGGGTCNITVQLKANPQVQARCKVTVLLPDSIALNKESITFSRLIATYVKAEISSGTVASQELVWSSDNSSVAIACADGKVIAVGEGTCYITVCFKEKPEVYARCRVVVELPD